MAKETKAVREAREARERKDRADHAYVTWHRRIAMVLLGLRNESQVSVTKLEEPGITWLQIEDTRPQCFWCDPFFPLDLPVDVDDSIILNHEAQLCSAEELVEDILRSLREIERKHREIERKEKLRTDALNKLTTEEREVLGI